MDKKISPLRTTKSLRRRFKQPTKMVAFGIASVIIVLVAIALTLLLKGNPPYKSVEFGFQVNFPDKDVEKDGGSHEDYYKPEEAMSKPQQDFDIERVDSSGNTIGVVTKGPDGRYNDYIGEALINNAPLYTDDSGNYLSQCEASARSSGEYEKYMREHNCEVDFALNYHNIPATTFSQTNNSITYIVQALDYSSIPKKDGYERATLEKYVSDHIKKYSPIKNYPSQHSKLISTENTGYALGYPSASAEYSLSDEAGTGTQFSSFSLSVFNGRFLYSIITIGGDRIDHNKFVESFKFL
jgi:hypothetical protein